MNGRMDSDVRSKMRTGGLWILWTVLLGLEWGASARAIQMASDPFRQRRYNELGISVVQPARKSQESMPANQNLINCYVGHFYRLANAWHSAVEISPNTTKDAVGARTTCSAEASSCLLVWAATPQGVILPLLQGCSHLLHQTAIGEDCRAGSGRAVKIANLFRKEDQVPIILRNVTTARFCLCSSENAESPCNSSPLTTDAIEREDEEAEDVACRDIHPDLCRTEPRSAEEDKRSFQWSLELLIFLVVAAAAALVIAIQCVRNDRKRARKGAIYGMSLLENGEADADSAGDFSILLSIVDPLWRAEAASLLTSLGKSDEVGLGCWSLSPDDILGRGHFATVYRYRVPEAYQLKDSLNESSPADSLPSTVAVKVFTSRESSAFFNELVFLRTLSALHAPNILMFLGAAAAREAGSVDVEWRIAMEYCVGGCLRQLLETDELCWKRCLSIASGIARAVAFLHSEVHKGGVLCKSRQAHRDINSRNVLVRCGREGDVVLADFGLAVAEDAMGDEETAEMRVKDIGTTRYMSPELLEGSLYLQDAMSALMQADAYAVGLVLWEVLSRTAPAYDAGIAPAYAPPYAAELHTTEGTAPSFEQMTNVVVRQALRPGFPAEYSRLKAAAAAGELVLAPRETLLVSFCDFVAELWLAEPEGRATVACTLQRFQELQRVEVAAGF